MDSQKGNDAKNSDSYSSSDEEKLDLKINFDTAKNFKNYFPHNNMNFVCKKKLNFSSVSLNYLSPRLPKSKKSTKTVKMASSK